MSKNATLTVSWEDGSIDTFEATWNKNSIESDAAERIFFNDEFDEKMGDGGPNMDIHLNENPNVKSRVHFEPEAGELYSTRPSNPVN
jgi:hypothetical protein